MERIDRDSLNGGDGRREEKRRREKTGKAYLMRGEKREKTEKA